MASYRVLSLEELEILKTDFIQFLAIQGISGEDWSKWQKQDETKCSEYIDKFSEFVFIQALEKVNLFERVVENGSHFIQFTADFMKFVSIQYPGDFKDRRGVDFENCQVVKGTKLIQRDIHEEKYSLLKQGFAPVGKERMEDVLLLIETVTNL